jgi:hypothetical protein
MAAAAATELGDHAAAQRFYQEVLEHAPPAEGTPPELQHRTVQPSDLWMLITAASANRDWAAVRSAGARLGLAFARPDGPVDEEWQYVIVRAQRDNGAPADVPAVRTGPATARVLAVLGEDVPLNHGDVVVFTPELLEPAPEDDAPQHEKERWRPVFRFLTLLDPAGYTTWFTDGAWPGDESWQALRRGLREHGFAVWAYSGDQYLITDPVTGDVTLPGLYAAVGVPPTASAAEADALLHRLTAGWPHPLSWLELARAASADPAPHEEAIQRYGL